MLQTLLILCFLFLFRLFFGLCNRFWGADEVQVYLIGLKFFTTQTWPFFGPDVIYSQTQIPGALQGLLVGLPFYLWPIPETPIVVLNILSFAALTFLSWYVHKRLPEIPFWLIIFCVMTLPWTMGFSTGVTNPSYVLAPSILFFVSWFETIPALKKKVCATTWAYLFMGFSLLWIFQIHMSWVLLLPFILISFYYGVKESPRRFLMSFLFFCIGTALTGSLLIPTFIQYGVFQGTGSIGSNIQLHLSHFGYFFTILARYISFAGYEVAYFVGSHTPERLAFLKTYYPFAPFSIFVWAVGLLYPLVMIVLFFKQKSKYTDWVAVRNIVFLSFLLLYVSFLFSVKSPSSHTFYILFPLPLIYSFYCLRELSIQNSKKWMIFIKILLISNVIFATGLGIKNFHESSLYTDRDRAVQALEQMDYEILGKRREFSAY